MVVCIALDVVMVVSRLEGVPARPYILWGDRVTWKVLAEYCWSPTITRSASSTSIRVITKEVRYIHMLSLILEYSIPMSSPAAPGLTPSLSLHWRRTWTVYSSSEMRMPPLAGRCPSSTTTQIHRRKLMLVFLPLGYLGIP